MTGEFESHLAQRKCVKKGPRLWHNLDFIAIYCTNILAVISAALGNAASAPAFSAHKFCTRIHYRDEGGNSLNHNLHS